jgi:protein O-GlcNAc transferase
MIRRLRLNDKRPTKSSWWSLLLILFLVLFNDHSDKQKDQRPLLFVAPVHAQQQQQYDGLEYIAQGDELFDERQYDDAAMAYWKAVLLHGQTPPDKTYNVQDVFTKFMQCYIIQDRMADGLAYVSIESFRRGQDAMGQAYLQQALQVDPQNAAALQIQREYRHLLGDDNNKDTLQQQKSSSSAENENTEIESDEIHGKTPEQLYEVASAHFANKEYEDCADIFEISCRRSGYKLSPSCANAVYCRNMILDWGYNGSQFHRDMERTIDLVQRETRQYRINHTTTSTTSSSSSNSNNFAWQRATSVHPHMMLGYPLADSMLKRYVAESVAYMDELMARAGQHFDDNNNDDKSSSNRNHGNTIIPPLPDDMPYSIDPAPYVAEKEAAAAAVNDYRIRVGFVGSGFNSKAVLYLSQDMFRFFDQDRFEIHVFSFGPADSPLFIQHGMRGVDWRERVKSNVYRFHDMQDVVKLQQQHHHQAEHIAAARHIHEQGIHILIEWDGYARQGERAQGLLALRPAPIQMLHQEYLGTSGAVYVDYLFTDLVSSPPHLQHLYTEKLVYLPNHFFSKGHIMQTDDVHAPTYEYRAKSSRNAKYELGRGSPVENRCLAPPDVGPTTPSFVFCNWNKLLKANPETVRSWIHILRQVPDSMLCLLENPKTGTAYLRKFVHEAAGTSSRSSSSSKGDDDNDGWKNFVPGDGDELNARIHFLPWQRNPFDHQRRNTDFCNIMLDSYPYNGHTVAQDALYAGVPIVTRSDGQDMCSRVTTSANIVLFGGSCNAAAVHLNAYNGSQHYEQLAIAMATNQTLYHTIRKRLIDSCLQRNPMHPYWDVPRYVKNFETGLTMAWQRFLNGQAPDHIVVVESKAAAAGTYDEEILAHPVMGNYNMARHKDDDDKNKGQNVPKEQRQQQQQGSDEL